MGPAKFTQHYEVDSKGVLSGVLRFDTVKAKYTVDEALALRMIGESKELGLEIPNAEPLLLEAES